MDNQQIIDTFRNNGGEVNDPVKFGKALVLVHVPKKDTSIQVVPLVAVQDGGAWYVVGTAAGSPKHPAWVHGLRRSTNTEIEVPGEPPVTVPVKVTEVKGAERDRIWEKFVEFSPAFADYLTTAEGRVFPVFRFDHKQ